MDRDRTVALLVGRDGGVRKRGLLAVVGVFTSGLGLWAVFLLLESAGAVLPGGVVGIVAFLAALSVLSAAVYAFYDGGLVVALALGSALPLAIFLVPTASGTMAPDESVLWGVESGLTFGLPAGAVGFLLGVGARSLYGDGRAGPRLDGSR